MGDQCLVEYIDYGDESIVNRIHLRELKSEYCKLCPQAFQCRLYGIDSELQFDASSFSTPSSIEKFANMCFLNEWKPLRMSIVDILSDGVLIVRLFNQNSNVEITPSLIK